MTIRERVKLAEKSASMDTDNIEKLIAYAFWYGKELGAHETAEKYNKLLFAQKERAEKTRYHKLAASIIGDTFVYCPDAAMDFDALFGEDETSL